MKQDFFARVQMVTLQEMLDAREARALLQKQWIARYKKTLVCFTLNIPGAYKAYPLAKQAFAEGEKEMMHQFTCMGIVPLESCKRAGNCGCEGYYVVDAESSVVKQHMLRIEEYHPLGRLFDLDVLDADGQVVHGELYGRTQRTCLICGGPVWQCARSRTHPVEALSLRAAQMIADYFADQFAAEISAYAMRAMLYEVCVTPKPGLVDRANCGAHSDMDIFTFLDSSCALQPYFQALVCAGMHFEGEPEQMLPELRYIGTRAESAMLKATAGVNTQKGLIFSIGLFCAGMGYLYAAQMPRNPSALFSICARIAGQTPAEFSRESASTAGQRVFAQYGLTGARGEAAAGYPSVRQYGYPYLCKRLENGDHLNDAGMATLLYLLAHVKDTNLISRGDLETLQAIQAEVAEFLRQAPDIQAMRQFAMQLDADWIARQLSPGGCADLLALSLLVYFMFGIAHQ